MKLGVFTTLLSNLPFEEALKYFKSLGIEAVEIGAGGFPGDAHLNPRDIISNKEKADEYKALVKKYNMEISALSCHGNPLHPNKEIASTFHQQFKNTILANEGLKLDLL